MATSPQKEGFVTPNSPLSSPKCSQSRYGRIRKPKLSSDFCSIDDAFFDGEHRPSDSPKNVQVTPKRNTKKTTAKHPEQSPSKVPLVTKTVAVNEEDLDTRDPVDLELVIPTNEISADNLWDTQILKANTNTSKQFKSSEETYKERKFFKRTPENEDAKQSSSAVCMENETKTSETVKNESTKHNHSLTDVEKDVTKVLKIVSNKNTEISLDNANTKVDVKSALKTYTNKRKSGGTTFSLPNKSGVPTNSRKTRKSSQCDVKIDLKPSQNEETLLDFSWEQNYLSESDVVLLTKQIYEDDVESFSSDHDKNIGESSKETNRVVGTILERKIYVKGDVPQKEMKTEIVVSVDNEINKPIVQKQTVKVSKQNEIDLNKSNLKNERNKLLEENEDEVMVEQITCNNSSNKDGNVSVNESIVNQSITKGMITENNNTESNLNKEQMTNKNKRFKTKLVTPKRSTRSSTNKSDENELKIVKSDEDMKTKLEDSLDQSEDHWLSNPDKSVQITCKSNNKNEDLCVKNVEETTDKEDDKKSLRESKIEEESSHITKEEKVLNTGNETKCDESIEYAHKNNNSEDPHTKKIEEKILENSEKLLVENKSSIDTKRSKKSEVVEAKIMEETECGIHLSEELAKESSEALNPIAEKATRKTKNKRSTHNKSNKREDLESKKAPKNANKTNLSKNNEVKEEKCLLENSSPKLDKSKHHKRNCEDLGTNVLEKNKFNEKLKKSKEESSSTDFIEEKEAPKKVKRVKRNKSKKNDGVEVHENVAENLDKADVMPDKKEETPVEEKSSSEITKKRVVSKKSSTKRNNENKGLEINRTEQTVKEEGADVSKIEDITEEKLMNQNKKSPPESHKTKRFTRNSRNYTNEDPSEIKIAIEKLNEDQVMSKNEEIRPKENSNYEDIKDIPFSERTNKKLKKLNRPKNKKMEVVQIEDSTTIISKTKGSGNLLTESLETSACDGEENDTKMNKLAADTTNKIVIKSKPAFKTKSIKLNNKKTKVRSLKSGNETNVQLKQKQMQNNQVKKMKVKTGKQLFVRLYRLKSVPNLPTVKTKIKRHNLRSNSVPSSIVIVRKKNNKKNVRKLDRGADPNKKIGSKNKPKKEIFSEPKLEEENVKNENDTKGEAANKKLAVQATVLQETKKESCDCVMCSVSLKCYRKGRKKSKSAQKNMLKKSASQSDIQKIDENKIEKSTPLKVSKKRIKSLPNLNPNDSETFAVVNSSADDKLNSEESTNFKEPSVNDVDFKTPTPRKRGRPKSLTNISRDLNKTSPAVYESSQKSEMSLTRSKSTPKKFINEPSAEFSVIVNEDKCKSLVENEAISKATTSSNKRPRGRPRKRVLKSSVVSKLVKEQPNVINQSRKRKRLKSENKGEKIQNLGTVKTNDNNLDNSQDQNVMITPKLEKPNYKNSPLKKTKLHSVNKNCEPDNNENDVQAESPKRKKRKIDDTPKNNKIEDVQDFTKKEEQFAEGTCKVGDLLWAKIGQHPYWPCMVTTDPKTELFRRRNESGKWKEWWFHVRFFGDNGLRSWVYSKNTLPFKSKDDLDELAEEAKSNKKLSDVYLSYKKMSTLKYDKWKAGVNEAESLIDKTIDEKFNFFFERFASRREKKGKLLNAIIDDSLLNNKQKKKLKMSILGRLTAKKIRKIMQKTSSDAFPDAIDFKGTFSSTPVKLRKIKQLNLSKSITEDIAEIAQKIKFESVDTTNATNESKFEVDASTNELPKKKSNLGQTIEKQLTKTPKNKKKLLGESVQNNSSGGINEEVSKPVESKEIKTDVVFLKNEELPSVEKKPILVKPSKSKRKMKSPVKRIIIPNDFNEGVYSSSEMKLKEPLNQSESKLNAEKNDDCKNVPVVTEIKIKMEPPEETVEDVIPTQKTNVLEVTKNKRKVQIFDGPPKFSSDLLANDVTSNEDVIIKEKVKKKKPDKVPNADISDASLKPKKKSSNQAKTETKIDGNVIIKTEKPDEVTSNDADLNKVEVTPELDETKTILVSLQNQVELYKRNNLFRGVTKKQVCQICEKGTDVVKCKGPCLGYFHVSCALKKGDPPPPANVDDMSSNDVIENSDVEIVTVDPKADIPDVLLSPETKILSLEDQIDLKMKEIMSKQSNKPTYEDVISECSNSSDDLSNKTKSKKEKKILKIHHVTADYVSYISIPEKSGETNETETIKSVKYIPTTNLDESLIPVKEENIFKCSDCASETNPQCFVCKKLVSNKNSDVRQKCANSNCGRFYHQDCLKRWPQTQWSITSKSKGSKQIFFCPLHVCHTCVSDNPRGSISKSSNENAKCMRCPATYHTSSYCIPAGTVILSNTQIICPRHLCEGIEKKSDKLVSKTVNASWCFLCSKSGGTLICCETCPTSVHEECLNIDSKLDDEDSCVCEDCETGRLPLYDEIVWVKLGAYRWWPAVILFPNEVPRNVQNMPHYKGQFVVKFFGTHDHYWVGRGRVFLFQEGDSTHKSQSKKQVDVIFNKAVEEASVAHQLKKDFKKSKEQEIKSDLKPPPYIKIKVNKPVGNVKQYEGNSSNTTACECNPDQPNPCGPDSVCLNRLLLTECNPEVCPAGAKCNNQLFEKRLYPPLVAFKTSSSGWGLKSLVPLYRGQFIIEYVGEVIDEEEYQRRILRMHEMKEENYYFLTIDKDRIIDAGPKGNLARFMNHSCQPNCETQKWTVNGDTRVGLFASVDIPENTELTFNYNLEYVSKEKKACRCGARNCVGFIGAKPVPKKIPKKKKPSPPPPVVVNSGPCFICGEEGQVGSCCNKICTKFYHLKCVNLESWPDKWVCPWHNCNLCTKRTIRCCVKCTNSYCPSHSDGNVRYDKLLGFVCTDHDPNKETHVLQIEDICRTPATFVTTAETDITSTTPDTTSSVEEHVNPPSIEDDEVSEITSNTQEIDIEKEKLKYAFFECQEKGVIPNNITESSLKAVQNKLKVAENEGSNKRKRSKPKRQEICDGGRSKTVTPSTDKTSDSDEELISKRKAEFDKDLPMRKRKKPRIEL